MTTAILLILILNLLWSILSYVAIFNVMVKCEESMKKFYDKETMRILTAMFNKERMVQAMQNGEEVEI